MKSRKIPKKIHYIWVGGSIPEKYLNNLLAVCEVAARSGFEVNLWVDKEKNYYNTLNKMQKNIDPLNLMVTNDDRNNSLRLKVRNISELKARMYGDEADEFYKPKEPNEEKNIKEQNTLDQNNLTMEEDLSEADESSDSYESYASDDSYEFEESSESEDSDSEDVDEENDPNYFWQCVTQEMIGFSNFAAAADLLRCEIIRQEGGIYIDVDNIFPDIHFSSADSKYLEKCNKREKLMFMEEEPAYGIKGNFVPYGSIRREGSKIKFETWKVGNDTIAAIPGHPLIEDTLAIIFKRYKELDRSSKIVQQKFETTRADRKRFPFFSGNPIINPRLLITMHSSGPGALRLALENFIEKENICTEKDFNSLMLTTINSSPPKIAGVEIIYQSHQTWLGAKKEKSLKGFTDNMPDQSLNRNKPKP